MPAGAPEDPDQASETRFVSRTLLFPADPDSSPYAPLLRQIMNTGTLLHQAIRVITVQRNLNRRTIMPSKIRRETRPATAEPYPSKNARLKPGRANLRSNRNQETSGATRALPHTAVPSCQSDDRNTNPYLLRPRIRTCDARAHDPDLMFAVSLRSHHPSDGSPAATHTTRKVPSDHPAIKRAFQTIQIYNPYKSSPVLHDCGQRRRSRRKIFFQKIVLCIAKYQSTYYICSNKVIYPQNNTPVTGEP